MGLFSQLFHRFTTEEKQLRDRIDTGPFQHELQALKRDLAALRLEYVAEKEKTSKKLESYRARSQPRKDGKFSTQEPAQSSPDGDVMDPPTHDDIENMARRQGLIR